jgi:RNA polymerase sigma factor (sigma-70 family)
MSDEGLPAQAGHDTATDADLARGLIDGDGACFDALYRRYARPVHDYALGIVKSRALAEDVTQATFLRAFEQRSSLRDPKAVRGWLYRIAHSVALNQVTRGVRTTEIGEDAPVESNAPGPEQLAEQDEMVRLVWDAAASLEPRQFTVLDLSLRKGLTSAEIAVVLGVDRAAASLAVHRSREALGNAVRYLAVARRRRHCERLTELVPAGVRSLTPEQRLTVDRHLRRCPNCQETAAALTAPAEMFAAVPLALLPASLLDGTRPWEQTPAPPTGGQPAGRGLGRGAWLAGTAAVVIVGVTALVVTHVGGRSPSTARPGASVSSPLASPPANTGRPNAVAGPGELITPPSVAAFSYFAASCPTSSLCLATGLTSANRPLVSKTTDGGATWETSYPDVPSPLGLTSCSDAERCVAAYFANSVDHPVRTVDGGATWTESPSPSMNNLQSMSCPSATECLAVGGADQVGGGTPQAIATTDGGGSWQAVSIPGPADSVSCPDTGHCWASGEGGRVWSTHDLGETWTAVSPPSGMPAQGEPLGPFAANLQQTQPGLGNLAFYISGVAFGDDNNGVAFGGSFCGGQGATECPGGVWRTQDGGETWTFWSPADNPYPMATFGYCVGSACLMTASTFTDSQLLSTGDDVSWSVRQTLDEFAGRVTCSSDGALCVVIGHTGLLVAGSA